MSQSARVLSVGELEAFRGFLVKLGEGVQHGLAAADAAVSGTQRWLGQEHPARLQAEHRKATRALEAALDDLRRKKYQPTATGDPASTVTERRVAEKAKAKLRWLEEKRDATRRWARAFDREADQFLAGTQPARGIAESAVPRAVARVDAHLRAIADYLQTQAQPVTAPGTYPGNAPGTVSRSTPPETEAPDDPPPAEDAEVDR